MAASTITQFFTGASNKPSRSDNVVLAPESINSRRDPEALIQPDEGHKSTKKPTSQIELQGLQWGDKTRRERASPTFQPSLFKTPSCLQNEPNYSKKNTRALIRGRRLRSSLIVASQQPFCPRHRTTLPDPVEREIFAAPFHLKQSASSRRISRVFCKDFNTLTEEHAAKRLQFALQYYQKPASFWHKWIFSDETSIARGDGEKQKWIKAYTTFSDTQTPSVAALLLAVYSKLYKKIYRQLLSLAIYSPEITPQHIWELLYKQENGIDLVHWPPYSPDLNPVENVWKLVKASIAESHPDLADLPKNNSSKQKLCFAAVEAWEELEDDAGWPELLAPDCSSISKTFHTSQAAIPAVNSFEHTLFIRLDHCQREQPIDSTVRPTFDPEPERGHEFTPFHVPEREPQPRQLPPTPLLLFQQFLPESLVEGWVGPGPEGPKQQYSRESSWTETSLGEVFLWPTQWSLYTQFFSICHLTAFFFSNGTYGLATQIVSRASLALCQLGTCLAVDECIVGYTGRSKQTVTVRNKPTPTGFKKRKRAIGTAEGSISLNPTQSVVVALVKQLPEQTYHVFFDNLFSSPILLAALPRINCGFYKPFVEAKKADTKGDCWPWGTLKTAPTPDGQSIPARNSKNVFAGDRQQRRPEHGPYSKNSVPSLSYVFPCRRSLQTTMTEWVGGNWRAIAWTFLLETALVNSYLLQLRGQPSWPRISSQQNFARLIAKTAAQDSDFELETAIRRGSYDHEVNASHWEQLAATRSRPRRLLFVPSQVVGTFTIA
ncbi:DDE superfamily endonuclease [Hirsutella rhossiliensis]